MKIKNLKWGFQYCTNKVAVMGDNGSRKRKASQIAAETEATPMSQLEASLQIEVETEATPMTQLESNIQIFLFPGSCFCFSRRLGPIGILTWFMVYVLIWACGMDDYK